MTAIGEPIARREDADLLTGRTRFVADLDLEAAHATLVRSVHAHARIVGVDVFEAVDVPGLIGIFTHEDLDGLFAEPLRRVRSHRGLRATRTGFLLARDEVHYVGEPIVLVVAVDRYAAEDAAGLIRVEYEPLPAVADLREAAAGTVRAHADLDDNVVGEVEEEVGDVDAACARAAHVVEGEFELDRGAAQPIETRGVLAHWDAGAGELLVQATTQAPLPLQRTLRERFGPGVDVDVASPPIGGGFGVKVFQHYPEELLIPWVARRLDRAVLWVEDRLEHFVASNHSRKQIHRTRMALDADGLILAFESNYLADVGAYNQYALQTPVITACHLSGPYRIPNLRYRLTGLFTNTLQNTPYRGAGVPYAVFALERTLDRAAKQLGVDRAAIRRLNFIEPDAFPYETGLSFPVFGLSKAVYDSGEYDRTFSLLLDELERVDDGPPRVGHRRGVGIACYTEITGPGPFEGARVEARADGTVEVATGATPSGQGHHTTIAQVVAAQLGLTIEQVRVTTGDSRRIDYGLGTFASRTGVLVCNAATAAARELRGRILALGAHRLECSEEDLELLDGIARLATKDGAASISIAELLEAAVGEMPPPGVEPGLSVTRYEVPRQTIFAHGMHAAVIDVDEATLEVEIVRYLIAHDCGHLVNPLIVEGQTLGAFAQGVGGALYERIEYDPSGQIQNASLMDYLLPYATEIPAAVSILHTESPSPVNELGLKGAGEGGIIPVASVIASAVEDALDVPVDAMPVSPSELFAMIGRQQTSEIGAPA